VGLAKNMPSAPGARTAWFKESVLLLQRGVGPEKQDPWIYHRTKSGWGPADPSPPARLLATRPCCGPGPERRPVLGEAPRFHAQAKGKNVRLDGHSRRATRRNSFCNGVTFTQRPIRLYEQVRLRLVAVRPGWSGALRFGFTAHDPSLMSAQDIPKYACPDLVTRPGYWAKALPENLALRDTVLAYWADRHGRVFYSVNDGEPVLFHCGVAVGGPLWALIDVYGITDEVQLLAREIKERTQLSPRSRARLWTCPSENGRAKQGQLVVMGSGPESHSLRWSPISGITSGCATLNNPLHLSEPRCSHTVKSAHFTELCGTVVELHLVGCVSKQRPCRFSPGPESGSQARSLDKLPKWPIDTVGFLPVTSWFSTQNPLRGGFSSVRPRPALCCPGPASLRDPWWGQTSWHKVRGTLGGNSFPSPIRQIGVLRCKRVRSQGLAEQHPPPSLPPPLMESLWVSGTLQSSPATTSPSGSLSGSQEDSDSDMAFSVNQSSSASESSLVTAPSSPLSPPVSPVFSPPEPAGSKNGECTVCFDGEVDTVIYTCGHMCLCHGCGLRLKRQARACCPICRRPIKDVIKIYRP
ncbi:NEU1B ligase, partial [Crocuta crocuta]